MSIVELLKLVHSQKKKSYFVTPSVYGAPNTVKPDFMQQIPLRIP